MEGDTVTSLLHCDAGNDRVGIGTNAPTAIFEIVDNSDSATGKFIFDGSVTSGYALTTALDDTGAKIGHNSASRDIQFQTDSTSRMTITGGGNVGINTTAPNEKLVVDGDTSITGALQITSNTSAPSAGAFLFRPASNTLALGSNSTERIRLQSDGRATSEFTLTAWITFDGTGTVSITDSHNCSSLTDNGTGDYTVTFTVAMANANYAAVANAYEASSTATLSHANVNVQSTTTFNVTNRYVASTHAWYDVGRMSVLVGGGDV